MMYPPTFVRTEKACSMAESSSRKEKEKVFPGTTDGAGAESEHGRVSMEARIDDRVTMSSTG